MSKFTGIDISKQTFDCSITMTNDSLVVTKMSNDQNGYEKLKKLLHEDSHVVMEASGPYYLNLASFLYMNGIKVSVINPLIIRRFCQMRMVHTKTDKKDAAMIREYGSLETPSLWTPDEQSITKLKQLNTAIDLMDKNITALSNQLQAFKEMPDTEKKLLKTLERIIKLNETAREKLESEMDDLAKSEYKRSYEALQSILGIGPKSAAILIAVTGNFKKFEHYKELVAYVGLNPRIFESGTSVKGKGHICKMGTARLRKLLYMCSWTAKRYNVFCKEMYERLKAKGKPEKVIKVAIANKLLRQAFAIGKNMECFANNYRKTLAN